MSRRRWTGHEQERNKVLLVQVLGDRNDSYLTIGMGVSSMFAKIKAFGHFRIEYRSPRLSQSESTPGKANNEVSSDF
jgi:hypothetical protein